MASLRTTFEPRSQVVIGGRGQPLLHCVRIAGTGTFTPPQRLSSLEIDRRTGRPAGTTQRRTGIVERPVVVDETSSGMAIAAAHAALAAASLRPEQIDLVLAASAVPEQPIPATAARIQHGLGLAGRGTPAFDINASCLSFVVALEIAAQFITCGKADNVVIASSEIASRALPWDSDPDAAALFGDGAAAAVISRAAPATGGIVATHMETWSEGYGDCEIPAGGTRYNFHRDRDGFAANAFFRMEGKAVYKLAARVVEGFLQRLLGRAGWTMADVDLVVPHQASRSALDHLVRKLKIPSAKIVDIIATHGNQIAASIPAALDQALRARRIASGTRILIVGTSAGFSIGGICLEHA